MQSTHRNRRSLTCVDAAGDGDGDDDWDKSKNPTIMSK